MRTVENPKKLFRKFDATGLDSDDSVALPIDEGASSLLNKTTVEFEDLSDPADDFMASYEAIEEAATTIDDADQHTVDVDTQFITEENGDRVIYLADTDTMGYEVVRQPADPRLAQYVVINDDSIVRIEPTG